MRRVPAVLVSLFVVAAILAPALRDPPRDSFPLSTYPMFSSVRGPSWVHVVVGFDAEGREHRVDPSVVANAEVMQAARTIALAVRRFRSRQLCLEVAGRVAGERALAGVERLEVQSRRFDPRTYFESGGVPERTIRRARCEVPR